MDDRNQLLELLASERFTEASKTSTRLVGKLKLAIENSETYETHQILRTVYFRFRDSDERLFVLEELLYHGAIYLINKGEIVSGQDIGNLYLEIIAKCLQTKHPKFEVSREWPKELIEKHFEPKSAEYTLCSRVADIAVRLPSDDTQLEQARYIVEVFAILKPEILNRYLLNHVLAMTFWEHKNYEAAKYHFVHCVCDCNIEYIGKFLTENQQTSSDIELVPCQFILHFISLQQLIGSPHLPTSSQKKVSGMSKISRSDVKNIATKLYTCYLKEHPMLKDKPVDKPLVEYPLLNFVRNIITILDSKTSEAQSYKKLCEIYKISWSRDETINLILDRIGRTYFGIQDETKQRQGGGFFNNILASLLDDDNRDYEMNHSDSSDELD